MSTIIIGLYRVYFLSSLFSSPSSFFSAAGNSVSDNLKNCIINKDQKKGVPSPPKESSEIPVVSMKAADSMSIIAHAGKILVYKEAIDF